MRTITKNSNRAGASHSIGMLNRFNRSETTPKQNCENAGHVSCAKKGAPALTSESGVSLIETSIAMVVILVGLLAVAEAFTFAIVYNAGNASRTQALAILQQETEHLRSKKYSPSTTDAELSGGIKPVRNIASPNGGFFSISNVVDDDPFTNGVQINNNTALKEITVTVRLMSPSPGWQTALPATVILRRARGN